MSKLTGVNRIEGCSVCRRPFLWRDTPFGRVRTMCKACSLESRRRQLGKEPKKPEQYLMRNPYDTVLDPDEQELSDLMAKGLESGDVTPRKPTEAELLAWKEAALETSRRRGIDEHGEQGT